MKKKYILLFVLPLCLFVFLYLNTSLNVESSSIDVPAKPSSIPESAFWVGGTDGGNFIDIKTDRKHKISVIVDVYNSVTGDIEYSGTMRYTGNDNLPINVATSSFIKGWDGEVIHLSNGYTLEPVK